MNELRDELATLLEDDDRRVLALAIAACVRLKLPDTTKIDPYNRTIVESIEAWARGEIDDGALAEVAARARKTRGGILTCHAIEIVTKERDEAMKLALRIDRELPASIWNTSDEGVAWSRDPKNRGVPFVDNDDARAAITRVRLRVATIARDIGRADPSDVTGAIERHRAFVVKLDQRWTMPAPTEPLPPGPAVIMVEADRMQEREPRKSAGDIVLIEAVVKHLEKNVGAVSLAYHDKDSRWVHVDVHLIDGKNKGDPRVLVTSGMSERPLDPAVGPKGPSNRIWSELVVQLPASWPFDEESLKDPARFWPLGWLRFLGRAPHRTGIGYLRFDSIGPLQDPSKPKVTSFDGVFVLPSKRVPPLAIVGRTIEFLAVCPIHEAELQESRRRGTKHVLAKIAELGDPEIIDPDRPCVV